MNQFLKDLFIKESKIVEGVYVVSEDSQDENQNQTNSIFSEKWKEYDNEKISEQNKL